MVRLHFPTSNNAAEYEALINGLRIAVELGIKHLEIRGDSELVVGQVMKDKNCVDPKMAAYCQVVRALQGFVSKSTPKKCCNRPKNGSNSTFATIFLVKSRCTCNRSNSLMQ
jgi:ribonuclease HI